MVKEEEYDLKEEMENYKEVIVALEDVDQVEVHMKMGFTYHISFVTLKMKSGPLSQMNQEEGSHRILCATSYS